VEYPWYSILKTDSLGNVVRTTSYMPSNTTQSDGPARTILDNDGSLFSFFGNNFILGTDTAGGILFGRRLSSNDGSPIGLVSLGLLANGDKAFLFSGTASGFQCVYLMVTSADASTIKWTKYFWSYNYINARMLADGDKIVIGVAVVNDYSAPDGTALIQLDAATGAVLQQRWFSDQLSFNQIHRYNNGYIFDGNASPSSIGSFYIRTDLSLNLTGANFFPAYTNSYNIYPTIFQPQSNGALYGFYSSGTSGTNVMTLFSISANDVIQWATDLSGNYQTPMTVNLTQSGIMMASDNSFHNEVYPGSSSGIQLYKSSYSGSLPACTNSTPTTVNMLSLTLNMRSSFSQFRDTSAFNISNYAIQSIAGPTLTASICADAVACNSIKISGSSTICAGSGTFTGGTNAGCSMPLVWSVEGGPGNAVIQSLDDNTVSISFNKDGVYKVKALFNPNCTIYADSLLVHVNSPNAFFYLGDDTTLCAGTSLLLRAGNNFSSYTWQDGSTDSLYHVTAQGLYSVTVQDFCGETYKGSVNVSYRAPLSSPFPTGVTKCAGDTLNLDLPSGFDTVYFILPATNARIRGDSIQFFNATTSNYGLQEIDEYGCLVNSNITVQNYQQADINIGDDMTVCPGDSVLLDAGSGLDNYQWNTGSQSQAIWAKAMGTYRIQTVTMNGCIVQASMTLFNYPAAKINLGVDTLLCAGSTKQLSAGAGFVSYLWNNGSTASSIIIDVPGLYNVQVVDKNGCIARDSILFTGGQCLLGFSIPKAFTPNNDGRNDVFRPLIYGNVTQYKFAIFNRWGQQVFESTKLLAGWDGTFHSNIMPSGAFVWYCIYQLQGQAAKTEKGTVLLIR
jgi:gliding motility-associated-like protein